MSTKISKQQKEGRGRIIEFQNVKTLDSILSNRWLKCVLYVFSILTFCPTVRISTWSVDIKSLKFKTTFLNSVQLLKLERGQLIESILQSLK